MSNRLERTTSTDVLSGPRHTANERVDTRGAMTINTEDTVGRTERILKWADRAQFAGLASATARGAAQPRRRRHARRKPVAGAHVRDHGRCRADRRARAGARGRAAGGGGGRRREHRRRRWLEHSPAPSASRGSRVSRAPSRRGSPTRCAPRSARSPSSWPSSSCCAAHDGRRGSAVAPARWSPSSAWPPCSPAPRTATATSRPATSTPRSPPRRRRALMPATPTPATSRRGRGRSTRPSRSTSPAWPA